MFGNIFDSYGFNLFIGWIAIMSTIALFMLLSVCIQLNSIGAYRMEIKENILLTVDDLVSNFLDYDRKEDEELKLGDIDTAIKNGEVTIDEIVNKFRECIVSGL